MFSNFSLQESAWNRQNTFFVLLQIARIRYSLLACIIDVIIFRMNIQLRPEKLHYLSSIFASFLKIVLICLSLPQQVAAAFPFKAC